MKNSIDLILSAINGMEATDLRQLLDAACDKLADIQLEHENNIKRAILTAQAANLTIEISTDDCESIIIRPEAHFYCNIV